jgi:RNA polymerase sigma factor (sigma-70 family)
MPSINPTPLTDEQSRLAADNIGLAYSALGEFGGPKTDPDRLLSAAFEGLVLAARGFKPERGMRFSTYAVPTIKRSIKRATRDGLIYVPAYQFETYRLDRNSYRDDVRRARQVASIDRVDPPARRGSREEDRAASERRSEAVREAFGRLPDPLRRTVELHLDGLPHHRIAAELRASARTVKDRLAEAYRRLRTLLEPQSQAG